MEYPITTIIAGILAIVLGSAPALGAPASGAIGMSQIGSSDLYFVNQDRVTQECQSNAAEHCADADFYRPNYGTQEACYRQKLTICCNASGRSLDPINERCVR